MPAAPGTPRPAAPARGSAPAAAPGTGTGSGTGTGTQEKAFLEIEGGTRVPCLFNPAQLTVTRSNRWVGDVRAGRGVPRLRYTGADPGVLDLDLFFDTTNDGSDVRRHTGRMLAAMDIDPNLPGSDEKTHSLRPPTVTFHWGDLHSFTAVVADLRLSFTYFTATGTPLRATLELTLRQYEPSNAFGPQNPTSGTPEPHRVHRVQPGETLDRIAARYYGAPGRWRTVADANGVGDPAALVPGTLLTIPRADS